MSIEMVYRQAKITGNVNVQLETRCCLSVFKPFFMLFEPKVYLIIIK